MARYTTQVWSTEEFPRDPLRCPQCNKQDLRLIGCVYRAFEVEIRNGESELSKIDDAITTEQIHQIYCHNCNILYQMEDQEIRDIKNANIILAEMAYPTPKSRIV